MLRQGVRLIFSEAYPQLWGSMPHVVKYVPGNSYVEIKMKMPSDVETDRYTG